MEKKSRRKQILISLVICAGLFFCCGGWLISINSLPGHPISCVWEGGKWGILGFGTIGCNPRTQDGGTICIDMHQCEGTCIVPDLPKTSMDEISTYAGTGICTTHRYYLGCIVVMKQGNAFNQCFD